jgi:hypothetical protein
MRLDCSSVRRGSFTVLLLVGLNTATARAQVLPSVSAGPTLVRGLGNHESAWIVGAGGEAHGGGYALGVEAHYVYFPEVRRTFGDGGSSEAPPLSGVTLSVKGSQYFHRNVNARVRPFLTAGFSVLAAGGMAWPMAHVGGGVEWWTNGRTGFRFEVREELFALLSFRCGVVLRPRRLTSR